MPDCVCVPRCPFFNDRMADMPSMAGKMKRKYCQEDPSACARYMVFTAKGREAVPPDLFPNQVDRAKGLVGAA